MLVPRLCSLVPPLTAASRQVVHPDKSENWTLQIRFAQVRDSGVYECQVNTEPKMSLAYHLAVVGESSLSHSTPRRLSLSLGLTSPLVHICLSVVSFLFPPPPLSLLWFYQCFIPPLPPSCLAFLTACVSPAAESRASLLGPEYVRAGSTLNIPCIVTPPAAPGESRLARRVLCIVHNSALDFRESVGVEANVWFVFATFVNMHVNNQNAAL